MTQEEHIAYLVESRQRVENQRKGIKQARDLAIAIFDEAIEKEHGKIERIDQTLQKYEEGTIN